MRSNVMGTRFVSYDNGKRPEQSIMRNEIRQEFCAIIYEQNVLGFKGKVYFWSKLPTTFFSW